MANGCVVASETSVGIEPLVPGVHFLMAPYEHLAEQAVALAFDEPRRAAMADAAYKLTTTSLSQGDLLQAALAERVDGRSTRSRAEPRVRQTSIETDTDRRTVATIRRTAQVARAS